MKKVSDLTVEEFKDLIKDIIKEELNSVQTTSNYLPPPIIDNGNGSGYINPIYCKSYKRG